MNKRNRLFKSFTAFLMSFCMVMPNNVITFADEESPAETADPVTETAEQVEETDVQQEQITEEEPAEEISEEPAAEEVSEEEIPAEEEPAEETVEYEEEIAAPEETAVKEQETDVQEETPEPEEEASGEAETTEAEIPEPVLRKYEYKDSNVIVKAVLQDAAAVPDDAELKVTPVVKNDSEYDYDAYMEALNQANPDKEYSDENTLLYDIAFMWAEKDENGKPTGKTVEYEPDFGKVSVSFSFQRSQISEGLGAEADSDVEILHLPLKESVKENIDTTKDAGTLSASDIEVQTVQEANVNVEKNEVSFDTDSFSLFAFSVDFHYNGTDYSIPGETQILLSDLIEKMHITADGTEDGELINVLDVESVSFTDEHLVNVQEVSGVITYTGAEGTVEDYDAGEKDFLLSSLEPFSTEEALIITLKDGTVITVGVTDAQDKLEVNVSLYDYDDSTALEFPSDFSDESVYAFVWVGNKSDIQDDDSITDTTPWSFVHLTDIKGHVSPYEFTVEKFSNNRWWNSQAVSYSDLTAEQKKNIKVRIIHRSSEPSLGVILGMGAADYQTLWFGGFDGYALSANHNNGLNADEGTYEVGFIKGNKMEHDVVLQFDPESDKGPIPAGTSYVLLNATSADGNNHYYYVMEATTDGSESKVFLPIEGNWSGGQPFSNNWKNITASVITPTSGTIETGGVKPDESTYTKSYTMGDYYWSYQHVPDPEIDPEHHIQHDEFRFTLKKAEFEPAIDPYDVLGEGAEYGVVANEYERLDHTETNFAVNVYKESTAAGIDLAANNGVSEAMPFYVGNYNSIHFTQNMTVNPDIYTPSTKTEPYVHNNGQDEATDHIHQDGQGYEVTVYPTSPSDVKSYVDGLIAKLTSSSETYVGKPMMKVEPGRVVDTTTLPDNVTIYVDATDLDIANPGWIIKKLEGQSIVFNIPGDHVKISGSSDPVFEVYKRNEETGALEEVVKMNTNTDGSGGSPEDNALVEKHILNHIVFNAYEATKVDFDNGPAGLFLAPHANVEEIGGSGTGWVATGQKFTQTGAEWHFFRTQRRYKAEGDFILKGVKTLKKAGETVDLDGKVFEFSLYKADKDGEITDQKPIQAVLSDAEGNFKFDQIEYTQADVPKGETKEFYYLIKETKPSSGEFYYEDVSYDAENVLIKVVAVHRDPGESGSESQEGHIAVSVFVVKDGQETVIPQDPDSGEKPVFAIGEFVNGLKEQKGSLTVKKIVNGHDAKGTYKIAVKNSEGHYFDIDGTDKGTTAFYVTFAKDEEKTWENLLSGDYTVEEEDAAVDGYTWTVTGTDTVKVEADKDTTQNVGNTYLKGSSVIVQATKRFNGETWPKNGFEFTLTAGTNTSGVTTPMPGSDKAYATKDEPVAVFGEIKFEKAGVYNYTIKEEDGGEEYIAYDTESHAVVITVTENPDTHELSTDVKYDGNEALEVTNTYSAEGTGKIEVGKKLTGKVLKDDDFSFTLEKVTDDAKLPKTTTVTNKNGKASFDVIKYTLDDAGKVYIYKISETIDESKTPGVTQNTSEGPTNIFAKVTVGADQGDGTLADATVEYYEDSACAIALNTAEFVNEYNAEGEIPMSGVKKLDGRLFKDTDTWTFTITADNGGPLPVDSDEHEVSSITIHPAAGTSSCNFVVGTFKYTLDDLSNGDGTYASSKTFEYTVTENGTIQGVKNDPKPTRKIKILVTDDGSGELKVTTAEGSEGVDYTNKYSEEGKVQFKATKTFNVKTTDKEFTFVLTDQDQNTETKTVTGSGTVTFSEVSLVAGKDYTYTLKEEIPAGATAENNYTVNGITYDPTVYTVTFKAVSDGAGQLKTDPETLVFTAEDGTEAEVPEFVNEYNAEGFAELEVTKQINDWGTASKFTFTLTAEDGAPMPEEAGDSTSLSKDATRDAPKVELGEIRYTTPGIYNYTIQEEPGDADGVTYDTTPKDVTVTVEDIKKNGELTVTVKYGEADSLTISNKYASTKATLEATKEFNDWGKAKSFTFNIEAIGDAPAPAVTSGAATEDAPKVSFGEIEFKKAGTYQYKITEVNDHVPGVTYDAEAHIATVTVSKDPTTNKLTADVKYGRSDELIISNTFTAVKKEFEATKAFNDWSKAKSFTFTLSAKNGAPMPEGTSGTSVEKKATQDQKTVKFGEITYEAPGTYTYTIVETDDKVPGVTYDTSEHTVTVTVSADPDTNELSASVKYDVGDALVITNTYASGDVTLEATKAFEDWGKAKKFTFELAAVGDAPLPDKTTADATEEDPLAVFGTITYEAEGTYEYMITELNGGVDGVTYDTTPHAVVVTVAKNQKDPTKLVATAKYDDKDALVITNTYADTEATIEAEKKFENWGKVDSFTFTLAAVTKDAPMPEGDATAVATKDKPVVTFGPITYEKAGTYEYTVTEVDDGVDGVRYDTAPHKVTVTVNKADDATNALSAEVTYDDGEKVIITNTFAAAKAKIEATKQFNDWGKAKDFTFTLAPVDGAPMPAGSAGNVVKTVTEDAVTALFGEIEYEKAGTYEYTITETDDKIPGITYDTKPHKVTVTVSKGEGNKLSADVKYDDTQSSLTIVNNYASADAVIQATKAFEDWDKAKTFTFNLEAVTKDAPMPDDDDGNEVTEATATEEAKTAVFGTITYETPGTYEYTITEVNDGVDGVSYDTEPHSVVVTVSRDGDGLATDVKYDDKPSFTITNTYTSVKANIEATKKFEDWGKADSFEFTLTPGENDAEVETPMPAKDSGTATKANPTVVFADIEFEKAGTYHYTVTEKNDGKDGVTYDTSEHNVKIIVTKSSDSTNALSAEVVYEDGEELIITNTYAATTATIEATKAFEDWGKAKSFTFNLEAVTKDAPMPASTTATATEDEPLASFGTITYEKAGTYEYTITEVNSGVDGVSYDITPHAVKVVVSKADDETNVLSAKVTYDGEESLIITNTYAATTATIEATKAFKDWGKADSFTFNLAAVTEGAPMPAETTATATEDEPLASFGTITYEKAGTYEYTITEVNDGVDGVTYDTKPHKVKVVVSKKPDATNALSAEVTYDEKESLIITNTYAATTATIEATKQFNDWGQAESFTFNLAAVTEGAPMPAETTATATEAKPLASFGTITYEKAGTYEYTITEVNDGIEGITYDTKPHKVIVTVNKDADTNVLSAEVKYDGEDALIITNTYASGNVVLQATKAFNDWGKAKSFTFNLAAVTEGAPMPEKTTAEATEDEKTAVFGSITYKTEGTYRYTITEVNDGVDGVSYDTTPHSVVVTVTRDTKDPSKLIATAKYDEKDSLIVTNKYTSVKADLKATKEFEDWGKADSFTFNLAAVTEGAPMPVSATATATKDSPTVTFAGLEFEKAGTYEYTITEVNDGVDGVTYDTKPHKVKVVVSKKPDATNALSAKVTYDEKESLIITNTYAATTATIEATKEFNDWGKAKSFTFNLAAVTEGAPMPAETTATATEAKPLASFGTITYEKAGTYKYQITEVDDGADGVTYDTKPHEVTVKVSKADDDTNALSAVVTYDGKTSLTIKNTYEDTNAEIEVKKEFNDWGKAKSFTFTLTAVTEGAPMPAETTATATEQTPLASFGTITYEKAGTYEYTITEVNDGVDGVTYDTKPHTVIVEVTKGEGNKLGAAVTYDGAESLIITNTYASTQATVEATKDFNDWGKAKSFTFTLAAVTEGAPMPAKTTAEATENAPKAAFGPITYEKAGTYEYTITEKDDGVDGVEYDTTPHKVIVTVKKEEGTNKLSTAVTYDGAASLTVTNTYTSVFAPVELTKQFNDWGKAKSFTFNLAAVTENAPMPAETTATATEKTPTASFGKIEFSKAGTYEYTITEVNDGVDGVSYDVTPHKVTVTVTKGEKNKLSAQVKYDDADSLIVTNTFTSVTDHFEVTKDYDHWLDADQFTFELTAVSEDAPMPEKTTAVATEKEPTAVFEDIEFLKTGTYEYTIREVVPEEATEENNWTVKGITYDPEPKPVTVRVTKKDDATNALSTEITYGEGEESLTITNTYDATGKTNFEANKALVGREWLEGETYTFRLKGEEGAPMPEDNTALAESEEAPAVFDEIEYGMDDVDKTYVYEIDEIIPDSPTDEEDVSVIEGVTYDTTIHTVKVTIKDNNDGTLEVIKEYDTGEAPIFTNTYAAEGEAPFSVTKALDGREWTDNDSFEFTIKAVTADAPMPETTTANATKANGKVAEFGNAKYTKEGVYEYTITETEGNIPFITYDTTPKKVKVTVTDENHNGELNTVVEYEGQTSLTVTNTYGELKFNKYTDEGKTLSGAELTLFEAGSNKAIVKWTTDGKEKDLMEYLEVGKSYVIKETKVPENYMPAEDVKFAVDAKGNITGITLQQDGDGVYHIIDAQFRVEVKKTDEQGRDLEGAILAVKDSSGKIVDQWETSGGVHVVKGLTAGESYTLTELLAPKGFQKAADQKFTAGKNGTSNVTSLVMVDKRVKSPDTSDNSNTAGWGISMGVSLMMALWALLMRRRAA